ncbi:MAG: NAD-dependent epimerase/dehydratase family protein [Acidimicrobiales bacterium]
MSVVDGRILVTGGAGFIGGHLVEALLVRGAERVVVVDNLFLGTEANLRPARGIGGDRLVLYRDDAGDQGAMAEIVRRERPTVVFNLATKALLYSFLNPSGACRVNLDIALALCELQRQGAFDRLVHLSSSEVYGTAQTVPMSEAHPLNAETTYAAGKAAADLAVASYVRMFELDAVTVRPFNNYGPRQNMRDFAAVVPITVGRILAGQPPVIAGDGLQTRDFLFVRDTVDALLRTADAVGPPGSVWNLGSGHETPIGELVTTVAALAGWTGPIERAPARPADVRRHCADVALAEAAIGPIATTSLEEGLAETVAWYLGHGEGTS